MHSCYRLVSNDMESWSVFFPNVITQLFPHINPRYLLNTKAFFVLQSKRGKKKRKKYFEKRIINVSENGKKDIQK